MTESRKTYLGDGVYAALECGMIKLTTENGVETTNEIFLEPEVWRALLRGDEATNREPTAENK